MTDISNIEIDISENSYKYSQNKHNKYVDFYKNTKNKDEEYWGLGIENESYLMFEKLAPVNKDFMLKNHKRERYSVNYWLNYKTDVMDKELSKLPPQLLLPTYINGYLFQKTDYYGEPTRKYTRNAEPNPKFIGKTIDEYIREKTPVINKLFTNNMIYDGDTFEFTTFNFYKTNVRNVIGELNFIKKAFLTEVNHLLIDNKPKNLDISKNYIFNDKIIYPPFNYGFAKFLTNKDNLAICNNGTYHINITLPTELNKKGEIANADNFKDVHSNAIKLIQWFEPFLIALYGSPDIMNLINERYAGGSLRLMMSRYIGLGTYNTTDMIKGKMLNDFKYKNNYDISGDNQAYHWFSKLHQDSPYNPPDTIGYDINYNKFTKHGIELRIFDYFPEEYLEDIINFIILLCQHSFYNQIPDPHFETHWSTFVIDCIKNGSDAKVNYFFYLRLRQLLDIDYIGCCWIFESKRDRTVLEVLNELAEHLYNNYKDFSICEKMSPDMKSIKFVDYNRKIKNEFKKLLKIN